MRTLYLLSMLGILCLSVAEATLSRAKLRKWYALTKPEVEPIARFAVTKLGDEYTLVRVKHVEAQIVQGLLYDLVLIVKNKTEQGVRKELCYVTVHYMAWLDYKKLVNHSCRLL